MPFPFDNDPNPQLSSLILGGARVLFPGHGPRLSLYRGPVAHKYVEIASASMPLRWYRLAAPDWAAMRVMLGDELSLLREADDPCLLSVLLAGAVVKWGTFDIYEVLCDDAFVLLGPGTNIGVTRTAGGAAFLMRVLTTKAALGVTDHDARVARLTADVKGGA